MAYDHIHTQETYQAHPQDRGICHRRLPVAAAGRLDFSSGSGQQSHGADQSAENTLFLPEASGVLVEPRRDLVRRPDSSPDLRLGDGPAPLLKTDVDQIVIAPSIGRGTDGRFGIDLAVRIRNVRAELAPGPPPTPPPSKKDPLTQLAETIQRIQGLDFPLPVDLRVMVEAAPLQVVYRAPAPEKQLRLDGFSVRFAMPSLASQPITAEVHGGVSVDGREMGKVSFNAKVSDLVTRERRIHLASALCAVDASLPGTNITLSGGLSQSDGFAARLKLNLPRVLAVLHPLIPPTVPNLAGDIELLLWAKTDAQRDLHATLTIDGTGVAARGGSLKTRHVGPLDLKLRQQIATDHVRQRVEFPGGSFVIPGLLDAAWSASVNRPTVPERTLDLQFGPLRLDLARALLLAAPFLPPGAPVRDLAGEASLRSLSLHLHGPGNHGDVALAGFGIKIPHTRVALKKGELTADDIELLLEKAACPLTAALPTRLTADLALEYQTCRALRCPTDFCPGGARHRRGGGQRPQSEEHLTAQSYRFRRRDAGM